MLIEERVELFVLTAEEAEFVEIMATLYPGLYSKDHAMWDQASFGSKVLNDGTDTSIKDWINFYRPQLPLVEKIEDKQAEFVEIMATLYPGLYSKDHAMWDQASFGSKVLNDGTDTSIKDWINFYRPQLPLVEEVAAFVPYFPSNGELLAVANSSRDIIREYNLTPELFQANGDVFFVMVAERTQVELEHVIDIIGHDYVY